MTTPLRKRSGYNDAAAAPGDTPPPRRPNACAANGCDLEASVTHGAGTRLCFVHAAIPEPRNWDQATFRLRRQRAMVEVVWALRRTAAPEVLARCVELCPQIAPLDDAEPLSQYALLTRAERLLIAECTAPESTGSWLASPDGRRDDGRVTPMPLSRRETHDRALENVRYLAGRGSRYVPELAGLYRRVYGRPCPVDLGPAFDRIPGADDE